MNVLGEEPLLLTLSEVGKKTGMSRSALYRQINVGKLKVIKIGASVRISNSELKRFVEALENGE